VRPGPIGRVDPFRHDALGAELARVGEYESAVLGDVLVELDANLGGAL